MNELSASGDSGDIIEMETTFLNLSLGIEQDTSITCCLENYCLTVLDGANAKHYDQCNSLVYKTLKRRKRCEEATSDPCPPLETFRAQYDELQQRAESSSSESLQKL
ncbi:hypothetical protein Droror1_Dr00027229 [Drosera rotundifolia]